MKTSTIIKRWMPPGRGILVILLTAFMALCGKAYASAGPDDWEWTDEHGKAEVTCDACGDVYTLEGMESSSDVEREIQSLFCSGCGNCSKDVNESCWEEHHCYLCGDCLDEGDYFGPVYDDMNIVVCDNCARGNLDLFFPFFCKYCERAYDEDVDKCECEYSLIEEHCTECHGDDCEECNYPFEVGGEDTTMPGCREHGLCELHLYNDPDHCNECGSCDMEICPDCGLCEGCNSYEEHCPECGICWGDGGVIWCPDGGEHCASCCEDNDWLCEKCRTCTESAGLELCDDCGYCEQCCQEESSNADCAHGYCVESSDYDEHLCPNCQQCPEDTECEYCGLCEDCQADYHCEHEICPESSEWDEHLCSDCGDCFEPDELCEYCGKCENCADGYHCQHDYCPDDGSFEDDLDHFICEQCGDCNEGSERCDYCEFCNDCCQANTQSKGCDHNICVENDEFTDHWCYEDEQCLEKCNHNADCAHANVSDEWSSDGNAHWKACEDCGAAVNKAIHTEGEEVTVTEPNPTLHTNGKANVFCDVCEQFMGTVSVPYVPIPEDGSPYIIDQPKDYEGKVSTTRMSDGVEHYATFKVKAGGKNLKYQWVEAFIDIEHNNEIIQDDNVRDEEGRYWGAKTSTLKVLVSTDDCVPNRGRAFICTISNDKGYVESRIAFVKAQHVFGQYWDNDDGTHSLICMGECDNVAKWTKPHRYGEWTLVRPATSTQTGLREQRCQDCNFKNQITIPKVEPGHTHTFDQPRSNSTEHWFACKCGIVSPAARQAHLWDQTVVIQAATERRTGQQEVTCSKCGMTKTERIDRLPHTHVWYSLNDRNMWVQKSGQFREPNTKYWGRGGADHHYFKCKTCDALNKEHHAWAFWSVSSTPTSSTKGRMYRMCVTCEYRDPRTFPNGTYPILMTGASADKDYARPGETVTITYDPVAAQYGNGDDSYPYPVKFVRWVDLHGWDGSDNIPYGESWTTVPRTTFSNPTAKTTTFVMPNGPATVFALAEECTHTNIGWGDQMNPTCTLYGHKRDRVCLDCGKVTVPGDPIAPLGHVLADTPIPGTTVDEYCTLYNALGNTVPNTATHGYSGDFQCTRCSKTVKGKSTPLKHGRKTTYNYQLWGPWYDVYPFEPRPEFMIGQKDATCTSDGNTGDLYCNYCNKLGVKGTKIPRLGHDWSDWEVVREASTKVKGMEQRVCAHDEQHKDTRITDYSGPDYRLTANKTKLVFNWTYGEPIAPQTVTFTSVGRNPITSIQKASDWVIGCSSINVIGMRVTITPKKDLIGDLLDGDHEVVGVDFVNTAEGQISSENITAPSISYTIKFTKGSHNLQLPNKVYIARPGQKFMSPTVKSNHGIANVKIKWTSSDNSIATVNPETGEVTPLSGGDVKIYANYEGDRYYKSEKVYYDLQVIGEQEFAGCIWQVYPYRGETRTSGPVDQTLKITPSTAGGGAVDIEFEGFTFTQTNAVLGKFGITGTSVLDTDDGKVYYERPKKTLTIRSKSGSYIFNTELEGGQATPTGMPIILLTMTPRNSEEGSLIVFGPKGVALKDLLSFYATGVDEIDEGTKNGDIYDLLGRKLDKITQPGIYIKDGKKILKK